MKKISLLTMAVAATMFATDSFSATKLVSGGALTNSVARAGSLRMKPIELKVADEKTLVVQELPSNPNATRMMVMPGGAGLVKNKVKPKITTSSSNSNTQTTGDEVPQNYDEYQLKLKDSKYIDVVSKNQVDVDIKSLNKSLTNGSEYIKVDGDHLDVNIDALGEKLKKLYVGTIEFQRNGNVIQWRYRVNGKEKWNDLISISELAGPKVEMDYQNGAIVWKYTDDKDWQELLSLSDVTCSECKTRPDYYNYKANPDGEDGFITDAMSLDDEQWKTLNKLANDNKTKFLVEYEPVSGEDGMQIPANQVIVDRTELYDLQQQVNKLQQEYEELLKRQNNQEAK